MALASSNGIEIWFISFQLFIDSLISPTQYSALCSSEFLKSKSSDILLMSRVFRFQRITSEVDHGYYTAQVIVIAILQANMIDVIKSNSLNIIVRENNNDD